MEVEDVTLLKNGEFCIKYVIEGSVVHSNPDCPDYEDGS